MSVISGEYRSSRDGVIDALRLPLSRLPRLHKLLDVQAAASPGSDRRGAARHAYHRFARIVVTLNGGVDVRPSQPRFTQRFAVISRDLSAGGFGFLHGAYVHVGTSVVAELESLDGEWKSVRGCIVRCRHVTGRLHEVGVKFAEPIDVEGFVTIEQTGEAPPPVMRLSGRLICVVPVKEQRDTMRDVLAELALKPTLTPSMAEALEMMGAGVPCDVLVLVMDDGADTAVEAARRAEWAGPILLVTRHTDGLLPHGISAAAAWPPGARVLCDVLIPYLELQNAKA